ncbi:MAG: DUF1295 domain-containing protein [Planctomycetota bacterium]|nr:DUF1295 domain-containing protein [Planctomycetota bacterium]
MMEQALTLLLIVFAGAFVMMAALWVVQLVIKNAGVVDAGWAAGLGASAVFYALAADGDPTRRLLIALVGGIWGLRLTLHLLFDRIIGEEEEGRYQQLREDWGKNANRNLFIFFEFQALLVVVLSAPFLLASLDETPGLTWLDYAGIALWVTGMLGVSIADRQLQRFKRRPGTKGKVCKEGLWRYSRHPNYFFEWIVWCSWGLIALGAPYGWIGLTAPALILFFILKVTGIPPTEKRALKSRGEAYREYQRTTSPFVPWPPKESAG